MSEVARARPPALTLEDLDNCGWTDAIGSSTSQGRHDAASAMRRASGDCETEADYAVRFLAEVLEMGLEPDRPGGPYFPMIQLGGRRSFLPRDLTDGEMDVVAEFAGRVSFAPLAARLHDIAWIHPRTKHQRHAEAAARAFTDAPLSADEWSRGREVSWTRALAIGRELGAQGRALLASFYLRLMEAARLADERRPKFVYDLSQLLRTDPDRNERASEVGSILDEIAKRLVESREFTWAVKLRREAARWWSSCGQGASAAESLSEAANAKVAEAEEIASGGGDRGLVLGPMLEEAIEILRAIPGKDRTGLRFDERITELRSRLREAQVLVFDHMEPMYSEIPAASEMANEARRAVRGKPLLDALRALVLLHRVTPKAELYRNAEESGKEFLFRKLSSSRHLAPDGRTIAKVPPLPFESEKSEAVPVALHADVVQSLSICQLVTVHAGILPAQEVLQLEHRIEPDDFVELCRRSQVVPRDRVSTMGEGLHAGFVGDYRTALYLLAPQLEHLARIHIQAHGGQTSVINDGIEQEKGLSALMAMPEAANVFGEDLGFELYVLFCDPLGPNLRNQVAHGLLSDAWASSVPSVYAWWFMLRLVMYPLLGSKQGESGERSSSHDAESESS